MNILKFIFRRLVQLVFVLIGLTIITFIITNLSDVDPTVLWGGEKASAEAIQKVREEFGLDQPLIIQYFRYIRNLLNGNLGMSLTTKHQVNKDLIEFFPATFELVIVAWIIALLVGLPIGIIIAVNSGGKLDNFCRIFTLAGVSTPVFWLGLMLQILFFKNLGWLPLEGRISDSVSLFNPIRNITGMYLLDSAITGNWTAFRSALLHILMPALTMSVSGITLIMRMTRSCMLEVLNKDYITMAKTYGLPKGKVFFVYALKNALIPIITIASLAICNNFLGSILIESVFDWPGIGKYAVRAMLSADFAPIMGVTLLIGTIYVTFNLIVDILYCIIDKRISYTEEF